MSLLILLTFILAGMDAVVASDVQISMLDGQTRKGQLTSISSESISFSESGTAVSLPVADVLAVENAAAKAVPSQEPQVLSLNDGSRLHGTGVVRTAKELTLESAGLGRISVESRRVNSVRLQADNPAYRVQWLTFLQRESEKDLLVVAKRDGSGLDFLAGVVNSIGAEKIEFLLDGENVPVPATRVYGVVFAKSDRNEPVGVQSPVRVTGVSGDMLAAKSISLENEKLQIETGWGQTLSVSLEQIQKIDLSGGRVQFLSDLEPLEERFDGVDLEGDLLSGLTDKEQQKLLFGPRRDSTMDRHSKIRLRGREYSRGLCIHSRTEISWALDQRFSSFDCIAGIDDEVAFNGLYKVSLKISGDERVLFEQIIATTDEPLSLHLPVDGVSTLTILVDFGDNDSTCDWLDLADAKLIIAKDKQ
jgi:hypothetical protein